MAFSPREKARIKHFLGYPDHVSLSQSIQLGYPAASQPMFLVDDAFHRMTEGGEESIRRDLCELESIEKQMSDARSRMKVTSVGNLEMNHRETSMLDREFKRWRRRLADDLGVAPDPYSQEEFSGGGINGRVVG